MCHLFDGLARATIFFLPIGSKNTNLVMVEDVEIFLPVKFRCRLFSGFRGEVVNFSANQRPVQPSCLSDQPEYHERGREHSQPIRGQGGHLVFPIGPKNTNLVENVEILLPVKFGWIPFSGFRGEVENVSANQRPWRPSCFSDWPEKHKLGTWRWDLASCQVSSNSVQLF